MQTCEGDLVLLQHSIGYLTLKSTDFAGGLGQRSQTTSTRAQGLRDLVLSQCWHGAVDLFAAQESHSQLNSGS